MKELKPPTGWIGEIGWFLLHAGAGALAVTLVYLELGWLDLPWWP